MVNSRARYKIIFLVLVNLLILTSVSCVSLPPKTFFNAMKHRLPELDLQNGRIYIFTGYYPPGIRMPGIKLDGNPITGLQNGGFLFADRPAGEVEIKTSLVFTNQVINLNLKPGARKYVEINYIAGYPASIQTVVLDPANGKANVRLRYYVGDWAPQKNTSTPPMALSK